MLILLTVCWGIIGFIGVDFLVDSFYHFRLRASFKCDFNGNWTRKHLVRKRTLNYLTKLDKWLRCVVGIIYITHLMHHMDKYSKYSLIVWSVSLNDRVFVYELRGCELDSRYSQRSFRYRAWFEQDFPEHLSNYKW